MCLDKLYDGAIYDYVTQSIATNPNTGTYVVSGRNARRRAVCLGKSSITGAVPSNTGTLFLGIFTGSTFFPLLIQPSGHPAQWAYYSNIGPVILEPLFLRSDLTTAVASVIEIIQTSPGES